MRVKLGAEFIQSYLQQEPNLFTLTRISGIKSLEGLETYVQSLEDGLNFIFNVVNDDVNRLHRKFFFIIHHNDKRLDSDVSACCKNPFVFLYFVYVGISLRK